MVRNKSQTDVELPDWIAWEQHAPNGFKLMSPQETTQAVVDRVWGPLMGKWRMLKFDADAELAYFLQLGDGWALRNVKVQAIKFGNVRPASFITI